MRRQVAYKQGYKMVICGKFYEVSDTKRVLQYGNLTYKPTFDEVWEIIMKAIYGALVASMDNSNIGDISNAMTKNYNNKDIDDTFNKVMCCYNNLTIDFPKTQQNISLGQYEEKFKLLTKEKPPYFFQFAKDKKSDNCKAVSNSNCDRVCTYIYKETSNKRYKWKTQEPFEVGVLCDRNFKVDTKSQEYNDLVKLMFDLKRREQSLTFKIEKEIKQLDKSNAVNEAISKYEVFYDMCNVLIEYIFNSDRKRAAEYLIDFEYLQRENCDSGKNILWNCFGDIILENIENNVKHPDGIPKRKYHYEKDWKKKQAIQEIRNEVANGIKKVNEEEQLDSVIVYKKELEWIEDFPYRKNCHTDRELLFILLVQQKRSKSGKVWVYANKRSALTCNRLDKMIGDGVCIANKGIKRLEKMKAISIVMHGKDMEITVKVKPFDSSEEAYTIDKMQKNPIIPFYEYNKERVIGECPYCKEKFIKIGNMKTCQKSVCCKQLETERKIGTK